ncbi:DUF2934 domain-containing protein [uncultured Paraglaciecola sp.]|uniref:DUF2934 domain-containing protein n=1 Tax=uncultured Paraglaciecola sp. TaxID=1765024 RepID=UPI0030D93779
MSKANTDIIKRKTSRGKKGISSASVGKKAGSKSITQKNERNTPCLSLEERELRITKAAYCRAEQRSFENGCALDDWLAAESEINAMYPLERLKT